ncbi:MAG: nucleotidyltransferase domain-containing protein [Candidatus Paceibacterota bacterium]
MITSIKGDIRQPYNEAMGNIAKGYSRWHTASSYFYDMERILLEMKMTRSFVEQLPDDAFYMTHAINAEDYIMYHHGYFLDLVHQLKDKTCQLISAITNPDKKYSSENERGVKLSKLLNNERVKRIRGLVRALSEWNDSSHKGPISIALKKRTNYHHFKNPLTGTESYFQAKAQRNLLRPEMQIHLSEYGKQMVDEKRKKNLQTWHDDAKDKMQKTSEVINTNLEAVSKSIVEYYKFPKADDPTGKRIFMRYMPTLESVKTVAGTRTITDIDSISAAMLKGLSELLQEALNDNFVALYVNGSMARGEFNMGLSDINIVVVLKDTTPIPKDVLRNIIEAPAKEWGIPTDIQILIQSEFMAKGNEKMKFVCKTDGVRIFGPDLLQYDPLPNKSYKLVWLLNSDFKNKLAAYRAWIVAQPSIPMGRRSAMIARDLAKRAYRMAFGQVIGNNTVYTASFKEMRRLFQFYTPENKKFLDMTYQLTQRYPGADKEGLLAMVDSYQRNLLPLYDRVNEVVNGVKEEIQEGQNPGIAPVHAEQ